eukprot:CAMPEP_0204606074 /NCGR_PEP_ID=MMETSP0661-20131031/58876_1 /ASSEMBLY_ACC=CAM_ASM_000606 /TAXON_ID=109239 /ORGANISM="Alexandrium margalefi, Strain AMGDE01CS-322" /LENGTH=232 /DNA_ID=CAMNT_0051617365 /DNA_START=63 /DNA_END=761 /DNA_ORIENTATION=+
MAPRRGSAAVRAALLLLGATVAWNSAFVGMQSSRAPPRSPMRGYRIDWMIEQRDGTNTLQTQDGYWVGEKGFEKSQAAQGYRYRMRPTNEEYKKGIEVDNLMYQFGPIKIKFGEAFGGSGNNEALRELKRKMAREGLTDPAKIEENEYWLARYGSKRWKPKYINQSQGTAKEFFRGLAAWSGYDPLKEERGSRWTEADYGKPWLNKYIGTKEPGWVTEEQVKKEYDSGKLLN